MGGNGESLAHGRIWSGPLKLLLPALCLRSHSTLERTYLAACSVTPAVLKACASSAPPSVVRGEDRIGDHSVPWWQCTLHSPHSTHTIHLHTACRTSPSIAVSTRDCTAAVRLSPLPLFRQEGLSLADSCLICRYRSISVVRVDKIGDRLSLRHLSSLHR